MAIGFQMSQYRTLQRKGPRFLAAPTMVFNELYPCGAADSIDVSGPLFTRTTVIL